MLVFSGTFSAGGLEVACEDGQLRIVTEGRHSKFVGAIAQVCYNAPFAEREGRIALFVNERCVLRATGGGLELTEIAPGIDVQRDVVDRMAFRPRISPDLKIMDTRLFTPSPMGLRQDMKRLAKQARAPRRQTRSA
jgi:propionate CoA-transferase